MCRGSDIPLLKDIRRNDGRYGNKFDGLRHLNFPFVSVRMIESLVQTRTRSGLFLAKRQMTEEPPTRRPRIDRRPRAVNGFIADAPSVVGVLTEVLIARSP